MSEIASPYCTILHLRFKLYVPADVFLAHSREAATAIASVEGLLWKVWVLKAETFEIGGIYLFASRETAVAYLNHPITQSMRSNSAVASTESQLWDVERSLSILTRAPLPGFSMLYSEPEALLAGGE